jgi:hypothetical protein
MMRVSDDFRGAVTGFVVLLCKGLLDDDRWEWDVERFEWRHYQDGFGDPTILKTTLSVFLNNLRVDESGAVVNYRDARFRGFQYFRALIDPSYPIADVSPPFTSTELDERDWRVWEA